MKNLIIIIVAMISITSCTKEIIRISSDLVTTEYDFNNIDGIDISGEFEVEVDLSRPTSGVITSFNKELQNLISIENINGTLKVYYNQAVSTSGKIKNTIYITTSSLNQVKTTGEVAVNVLGNLITDQLDINMTGESKFVSEVNTNQLNIVLTGESVVNMAGSATHVIAEMAGESYFSDFGLIINDLNISMAGESSVKLHIEDTIELSAAGESVFRYMGNAAFTAGSTAGESKIIKVG